MEFIDNLDHTHLIIGAIAFALGYAVAFLRGDGPKRPERRMPTASDALARTHHDVRQPPVPARSATREPQNRTAAPARPTSRNWFAIVFLLVWLVGWTFGIFMAATEMLPPISGGSLGFDNLFVMVWLALAVAGWFLVVRVLIKLLRGEPLKSERDS
ncbi:MAG: hypothetical protein C0606_12680 [Hyphomicrobiales bacterium]|nr:MAG: hypothetical protein C0606_12680 [Hyphomicrobiales bacterium]